MATASNGREGEAAGGDGVASNLHQQAAFGRGLLGLAAVSTAITLLVVVSEPPPSLINRNAYFVALSGLFFAGMAQVCGHVAGTGSKLVLYAPLVVAAGFTAAASLLL